MRDIWDDMLRWLDRGQDFAVARVVETWGSSPRAVGAAMLVGADMEVVGSVSGGCIEGAVVEEALGVLDSGEAKEFSYGIADEKAWSVGLSCGGEVEVLVERHWALTANEESDEVWSALASAVAADRPVMLFTRLNRGSSAPLLVYPEGEVVGDWGELGERAVSAAREAYAERRSGVVELGRERVFIQVLARRDKLIVVGAGHIAVHLVPFAQALDFAVTVVDPRQVFVRAVRFPSAPDELVASWPRQALEQRELDDDTYAVLLTHDPKIDDEALAVLLSEESEVRYIGALGSRKTHARRVERLRGEGFSEEAIGQIKGPVGMDIGAKSPAEIALSIMAEVVAVRRER